MVGEAGELYSEMRNHGERGVACHNALRGNRCFMGGELCSIAEVCYCLGLFRLRFRGERGGSPKHVP